MLKSKTITADTTEEIDRMKEVLFRQYGATAVNGSITFNGLGQYVWSGEFLVPENEIPQPVPGGIKTKIQRR